MVEVEGGSIYQGTNTITVASFWISQYELSQAQYESVVGENPVECGMDRRRPVSQITWYDAVELCNLLSLREGYEPAYEITWRSPVTGHPVTAARVEFHQHRNGYRLPTEDQWEYAARGGMHTKGFVYSGSDNLGDVGWYIGNSWMMTHGIGRKRPNELGIYDMSGNVAEYCWRRDWGDPGTIIVAPSSDAILRGGDFTRSRDRCAIDSETLVPKGKKVGDSGIRLVLPAEQ